MYEYITINEYVTDQVQEKRNIFTMVNGNYVMYGDRSVSDSEIVEDHIVTRTAERRPRRKGNRTASELQHSLNLAQLENETDSIKHEKRSKEPRLLRYVPTTDVEEHYVSDKFETYDLKPSEATPRRYAFKKKPRNPADGSVNYAYSRSSSSCSSPSGNLPPIAEHEPRRTPPSPPSSPLPALSGLPGLPGYESKLDKYFTKPKEHKSFAAQGSHPDSLYRVPTGSGLRAGKMARALRIMRWPVALVVVCVALAVFVYFLMPDNFRPMETENGTYWESNVADADTHRAPDRSIYRPEARDRANANKHETRTPEIDFYAAENDKLNAKNSKFADKTDKMNPPVPPVFPTHLTPEVQYGNENADTGNLRSPKTLHQANAVAADSTLKPHITHKPEKPLAIYFKDGKGVTTTTTTEAINSASRINNYEKMSNKKSNKQDLGSVPWPVNKADVTDDPDRLLPPEIQEYYPRVSLKPHINFTSGHSKLFGISIEDAKKMHSTTQSSIYNTRVSPTLPTWRERDDTTTKKYPIHANHDVSQCRSTSLPLCRGVLPYDLASKPAMSGGVSVRTLLPHIEYVASTNCSSRFRSFVCVFLEPECSPPPLIPKKPCYSFCKAITDSCESDIPRELESMFVCEQYSRTDCVAARAPCSVRELACGDGSCVPREWICNGRADCPAGEDEAPCHSCDINEFRCSSGTCIHKRWVCDGYADCPNGDDEAAAECGADGASTEPGEEPAGSAPAPAVHRPNKVSRQRSKAGDIESSKELLMTSESSNAVKRNFTRRPVLARLTPYSPAKRQGKDMNFRPAKVEPKVEVQKDNNAKRESKEDMNADELNLFGYADGDNAEIKPVNKSKVNLMQGRAPPPPREDLGMRSFNRQLEIPHPTKLDKTINKLEFVLDGVGLLQKAVQSQTAPEIDYQDSVENTTKFAKPPQEDVPRNQKAMDPGTEVKQSAHASPCPSGELRCVDGRCITLAQLCDGSIDCSDHADEDNCYT